MELSGVVMTKVNGKCALVCSFLDDLVYRSRSKHTPGVAPVVFHCAKLK
jgi:hypothetical protein